MPFTISHAAAALPLRGLALPVSAVVVGSMAPDLPLFVPFLPVSVESTHTVVGLLLINVVLGMGLFVVWHAFLAGPLLWFSPTALRARIPAELHPGVRPRLSDRRGAALVIAAVFVGGLTHQFLDLFTHADTLVTSRIPWFTAVLAGLPVHDLLQYLFTLAGAVMLALWAVRWWRTAEVRPVAERPAPWGRYTARAGVAAATLAGVPVALWLVDRVGDPRRLPLAYAVSATPVVLAATAAAVVALVWHIRRTLLVPVGSN